MFSIIYRLTISYGSSNSTSLSSASSYSSALLATPSTYFSTHLGFKGLILFYWLHLQFHFLWYYYNILLQGWSCIDSSLSSLFDPVFPVRTFPTILLRGWSVWQSNNFCRSILLTFSKDFYQFIHCIQFYKLGCIDCTLFTIFWTRLYESISWTRFSELDQMILLVDPQESVQQFILVADLNSMITINHNSTQRFMLCLLLEKKKVERILPLSIFYPLYKSL